MQRRQRRIAIGIDLDSPHKHHTDVAGGILAYARQHDWECRFEPFIGPSPQVLDRRGQYDGIIARVSRAAADYVRRARIPTVNVWLGSPDRSLPRVVPDQHAAGRMAAAHLLERGFRRFGFLGYRRDYNSVLQLNGLQSALAGTEYTCSAHTIPREPRNSQVWHHLQESLVHWVNSWKTPIGVFATQDVTCRYLANVCLQMGLRIPDDVSLIACGLSELICEHLYPPLTSIEHNFERIGYLAARLLDRLMAGATEPSPRSTRRPQIRNGLNGFQAAALK
ncbi:MAG: substrate-binding domain-containing protein [Planctomycetota bacterium]|nr:substrate-binding domain-containing protein [Planctomycetota bacterium]